MRWESKFQGSVHIDAGVNGFNLDVHFVFVHGEDEVVVKPFFVQRRACAAGYEIKRLLGGILALGRRTELVLALRVVIHVLVASHDIRDVVIVLEDGLQVGDIGRAKLIFAFVTDERPMQEDEYVGLGFVGL